MVASSWKGHKYIREYAVPANPNSELQEQHRAIFKLAVQAWHALSDRQKEFYSKLADGFSGYNLFIGRFIEAVRNGKEPETPIPMQWTTVDGMPVAEGWLIVRQKNKPIFLDSLKDAKGEVALTPSDTPYTFVLRRGTQEDVVLTVNDLLETNIPLVLESTTLGIKLVATAAPQPSVSGLTPN